MKKILLAVLAFVFMLPVVVKADVGFVNSFYNDKVTVNSEVVVNTLMEFAFYPSKLEYTYDPNMLSITKDNIKTPGLSDVITIENGKVTIIVNEIHPVESYGRDYVTLRFTALKAGTTEIEPFLGADYYSVPGNLKINISEASSSSKETNKETEKEETKEESNNDLALYISLGANGLLFILLIIALLTRKNKNV